MKRILSAIIALAASMLLCLPASADHSVLPKEGNLNETEALNCAVSLLCADLGLNEEDIRGHWYYDAVYYTNGSFVDTEGSIWTVHLVDPDIIGETERPNAVYRVHSRHTYDLRADTGTQIADAGDSMPNETYENAGDPLSWLYSFVPTADQVQPHEAIEQARMTLAEAVGPDNVHEWKDYLVTAVTDQGRFWYRITLGHDSIDINWPLTFTMWIDANSGEVIWHSDAERLAFRYEIYQTEGSWTAWFNGRLDAREAEWGPSDTWDYRQHAAFEEECGGKVYWPEREFALPGASDVSFEAARDAAVAWVAGNGGDREWHVIGSWFHDNDNAWIDEMMHDGIPPAGNRYWEIGFESTEPTLIRFGVEVDPTTGEVLGISGW